MWTSCLSVDLRDGTLKKHAELLTGRTWHGACLLQNKIFVAGGHNNELQTVENGEYYDLQQDKWVEFFQYMDDYVENITLVEIRQRFIFAFGGKNNDGETPSKEIVRRFDSLRWEEGW